MNYTGELYRNAPISYIETSDFNCSDANRPIYGSSPRIEEFEAKDAIARLRARARVIGGLLTTIMLKS